MIFLQNSKLIYLGSLLILFTILCSNIFALSPDEAIVFVSSTNNFLLSEEQAGIQEPRVMIKHASADYWVVAVLKDTTVNLYIPINNELEEIEQGDVTLRKLLETNIVVTKITQLKNSSYGLNWPLSYTTRSTFDGLNSDFSKMISRVTIVETKMDEIATSDSVKLGLLAGDVKDEIEQISSLSNAIAENIDVARVFEEKYLLAPDTNQTSKYKKYLDDYFDSVEEYKLRYDELESNLNELKQGIASLSTTTLTQTDKEGLINYLSLPTTTGKLPSFFSQTNQIKTAIDSVFSSSNSLESIVLNLNTRVTRNLTWKQIYGNNTKINKLNSSIFSISEASEIILNEENVNYWIDQENVALLKINWNQTKTRYENQEYDKAQSYAKKAEDNILPILEKGFPETVDNSQDLIIQIIAVLIIALIIIFGYEKFYLKKKKLKEEEFNEP